MLVSTSSAFAGTGEEKKAIAILNEILNRYQTAPAVQIEVSKDVTMALLEKSKSSRGKLFFAKGRMRMELDDPEKTTVVADGNNLWLATRLPKEFGGHWQVSKSNQLSLKKSNALMAVLFGNKNLSKDFRISLSGQRFELTPKRPDEIDLSFLRLKTDPERKQIREIEYADSLENQTRYRFLKTQFDARFELAKLNYKPPADAEVTEF